jgi:hypothetical protein
LDLSHVQFSKEMSTYYSGKLMNQLIHTRNSETGKLRFFSKILAIECPIYNSVRDKFFTLYNRKFNETTEVTINRLLNPSSSQDLNNICLYLKESYSLRDSSFKKYFFIYLYHKWLLINKSCIYHSECEMYLQMSLYPRIYILGRFIQTMPTFKKIYIKR